MDTTGWTAEMKELHHEIEVEMQARRRKNMGSRVRRCIKLILAILIGYLFNFKYSDYVLEHQFPDDIKSYLQQYLSENAAGIVAELLQFITLLFCGYCMFYPVHLYLKTIGWYEQAYTKAINIIWFDSL